MADDHKCLHEGDWVLFKDHQEDMGRDLKAVLKMLRGNGEPGIVTKLALQKQCMEKLHKRLDEYDEDLKEEKKERKEEIKGIKGKVWSALISVVMLVVALGIKHLMGM